MKDHRMKNWALPLVVAFCGLAAFGFIGAALAGRFAYVGWLVGGVFVSASLILALRKFEEPGKGKHWGEK
jgi:hypothetical protein